MKRYLSGFAAAVAPLAAILLIPSDAHAALDSCGGVFLSADAKCEFHKSQDCVETCKVVSVEESCAAELYTTCEAGCTAAASTECTQTCSPVCVDDCTKAPAAPTSDEICRKGCVDDCNTKCADAKNPGCCAKACPYTCNKKCEDRCHDDDQMTECTPKCVTACDGTCTSKSNTSCQVDCQTTAWEKCQTTTRERCTTSCMDKGGAIVCDGEFLSVSNLQDCAAELSAKVSIDLDVSLDVKAHVDTKVVSNSGAKSSGLSCAFAPAESGKGALWIGAALLGMVALRRRSH
jgi:hypothetical protein